MGLFSMILEMLLAKQKLSALHHSFNLINPINFSTKKACPALPISNSPSVKFTDLLLYNFSGLELSISQVEMKLVIGEYLPLHQ